MSFLNSTCISRLHLYVYVQHLMLKLGAYMAFVGPTNRPTTTDCSDSSWHVEPNNAQGCTNFNVNALDITDPNFLFSSAEECCSFNFESLDCSVRDNCKLTDSVISATNNIAQSEDSCDNAWHPDIENKRDGCSNTNHFPSSWYHASVQLVFDTVEECCQSLYFDRGNHCKMYNYCATPPTTSRPSSLPPSSSPTSMTQFISKPTDDTVHPYYPDLDSETCLSDGKHGEYQPYLYPTLEECVSTCFHYRVLYLVSCYFFRTNCIILLTPCCTLLYTVQLSVVKQGYVYVQSFRFYTHHSSTDSSIDA